MKNLTLIALAVLVCGCHHSEFDVSPEQVSKKVGHGPGGALPKGMPDLDHLPPGAVKNEKKYKKGDTLPDGRIADRDMKMITVEMGGGPGGAHEDGKGEKKLMINAIEAESGK